MGICPSELLLLVIRPTLQYLGEDSPSAQTLLVATAAIESGMGFHLTTQHREGLGVFQISPECHQEIWDNYLAKDPELASKVRGLASQHEFLSHPHEELATNLRYATAIAWLVYKRTNCPLPAADDIPSMAKFWRSHFHQQPQASIKAFIKRYKSLISAQDMAA